MTRTYTGTCIAATGTSVIIEQDSGGIVKLGSNTVPNAYALAPGKRYQITVEQDVVVGSDVSINVEEVN